MYIIDQVPYSIDSYTDKLLELPEECFFRYDNPFEQKWALRAINMYNFEDMFSLLEEYMGLAQIMTKSPLDYDDDCHFYGVFKYDKGDVLRLHRDADIHPISKKRKHVTALLYLSYGSPLEFWESPNDRVQRVYPKPGLVVLFDDMWHRVPKELEGQRLVITCSFMSNETGDRTREHALFVPAIDDVWTEEMHTIAKLRAEGDPAVYRT